MPLLLFGSSLRKRPHTPNDYSPKLTIHLEWCYSGISTSYPSPTVYDSYITICHAVQNKEQENGQDYFVMRHKECGLYTPHMHSERLDLKKIADEKTLFVCRDSDVSFCNPEDFAKILDVIRQDKK